MGESRKDGAAAVAGKANSEERGPNAGRPVSSGPAGWWPAVYMTAGAAVLLQVAQTLVSVFSSAEQFRLAGALVAGGVALLRGLITFGAVDRRRWSLWGGITVGLLTMLTVPLLVQLRVETGPGKAVEMTPL